MFPDLPEHLQSLNSVSDSPPSAALNPDFESNFFDYILAGDLFGGNNDLSHAPYDDKPAEPVQQATPTTQPTPNSNTTTSPPSDLKSFIAQFASDHAHPSFGGNAFPLPLPLPYDTQSVAPTPAGVNTAEIMPQTSASGSWETSPLSEEARISGAKRLKSVGAPPAEIEEDKRRRNTEASARFRAKKKEREQTLERRAKDLEAQVARLTADKASLENENRLLKTIVLGASNSTSGPDALQLQATLAQLGAGGAKRKRD